MADIVINDETFPGVASVTLNSTTDTATFLSTDYVLVGTPEVAETAADMTETDKIYVYVGSETGYTAGNWYYFNGTSWESGGVYGSSGGGISNNARNLLKYVLQRVAYTETGMEVYVNALYQALAETSGGGTTYDYVIANALVNVTSNNSASGINDGDSYTATLTADSGATMDSVTVYMDDEDITSTAYNSSTGVVSIASATGDIIIIATATAPVTSYTITNALSYVTNSNASASIQANSSYSATLTADTGYTLSTVTVTMGGTDVTSTVYSSGTITIASVTGDIVITASAVSQGVLFSATNIVLDGTSTYDTGIKLLETEQDFTILMDVNITSVPSGAYRFFYNLQTASPYYGIQFGRGMNNTQLSARWGSGYSTWDSTLPSSAPYRIRLGYTHSTTQQTKATAYQRIDSASTTSSRTITGSYLTSTGTLKLNGPSNTWWAGTVSRVIVYDHVLTSAEIDAWFTEGE